MLASERHQLILELIEKHNSVSVVDLCALIGVSEMTIRRDLRILSAGGLLQRVHGGAIAKRSGSYEPPYLVRGSANTEAKRAISREAVKLVNEGDSLALDVGTTTYEIACGLVGVRGLTVLTASLLIANVLVDAPNLRLILTGGILRQQEKSMVGQTAINAYLDYHVDKAFVGIGGLHLERGLTEYNLDDALVKQALIKNAARVIVVADSAKLQRICFAHVADLTQVHTLITDNHAPDPVLQDIARRGIEIIIAHLDAPQNNPTLERPNDADSL